jgi:hypothetical protein
MGIIVFEELVNFYFKNLIDGLGGIRVNSSPNVVRYETASSFVEIFWGGYDKEVGIHFGDAKNSHEPMRRLDFALILKSDRPDLARDLGESIAPDRESLQILLSKLSKAFQPYAEKILNGDVSFYEKAGQLRFWNI